MEKKSLNKFKNPKRLFLRNLGSSPIFDSHLNYTLEFQSFEVCEEELEKGLPGVLEWLR